MPKRLATLIFSLSFIALMTVSSPATYALDVCNPPQSVFEKIQDSFDRNIRETAINHVTSLVLDWQFNLVTGLELAEFMGCANYVATQTGDPELKNLLTESGCDTTPQNTCQNVLNQYDTGNEPTGSLYNREKLANAKIAGSGLGIAYLMTNSLQYEPLPVNTAYFFKDYAYRLPIVGDRVLAADVDYRHTFINAILGVWKVTRNAAYALMAIIMLYVGITIIMRRQINQKVVVTVQYALPKIILALILIAFSYPIGALMASLAWSLFNSAHSIVQTLGAASGAVDPTLWTGGLKVTVGGILMIVLLFIISGGGIGIGLIALVVILAVLLVGLYIVALFKALMLFLRMLIGIVIAPITFAIGAIPGNEDKTMEWFKQMASYGLGIFSIGLTIELVHTFGLTAIRDAIGSDPLAGYMFAVFGFLFIFIYGYTFAITVPEKIERALMGPKKR